MLIHTQSEMDFVRKYGPYLSSELLTIAWSDETGDYNEYFKKFILNIFSLKHTFKNPEWQ